MVETFGIIGGYGTVAPSRLQELVRVKAEKVGIQPPVLHIVSEPEPTVDERTLQDVKKDLNEFFSTQAKQLENVTHILTLYSTFHVAERFMQNLFGSQHVSIPGLVIKEALSQNIRKPLVVSSEEGLRHRLFSTHHYNATGLPNETLVLAGRAGATDHEKLQLILNASKMFNNDAIILGCSDLSSFADTLRTKTSLPVVDCVETAAKFIIERS